MHTCKGKDGVDKSASSAASLVRLCQLMLQCKPVPTASPAQKLPDKIAYPCS